METPRQLLTRTGQSFLHWGQDPDQGVGPCDEGWEKCLQLVPDLGSRGTAWGLFRCVPSPGVCLEGGLELGYCHCPWWSRSALRTHKPTHSVSLLHPPRP